MISAFVVLNKPSGMSSASAVARVKRILSGKGIEISKIGHFGTLDPDAEGVLPVALNRATRLFDHLGLKTKVYYAEFVFGVETDTLDASGIVTQKDARVPRAEELICAAGELTGDVMQLPPKYSAKSVDGKRAYERARAGEDFILKPSKVHIDEISLIEKLDDGAFSFRITAGGGTYVRSIARDLAYKCGTCAHMRLLRREKSGCFAAADAVTLDELDASSEPERFFVSTEEALSEYPAYEMIGDEESARLIFNGVNLRLKDMPDGKVFRFYVFGELAGLAEKDSNGRFHWVVRLI